MKTVVAAQRGFSTIAAIFLLVVLAALGAFMVTISNTSQLSSAQDIQGSRAYWAAKSGAQWAIGSLLASPVCPVTPSGFGIEGFSISIACSMTSHDEGGVPRLLFHVTSTASAGGSPGGVGYVERQVSVSLER